MSIDYMATWEALTAKQELNALLTARSLVEERSHSCQVHCRCLLGSPLVQGFLVGSRSSLQVALAAVQVHAAGFPHRSSGAA